MVYTAEPIRRRVEEFLSEMQQQWVVALEELEPDAPKFKRDSWTRTQGGRGLSCVSPSPPSSVSTASNDSILEKAGVNISVVHSTLSSAMAKQMCTTHPAIPTGLAHGLPLYTTGISLIVHPRSPHAPSAHCHYRYVEVTEQPVESQDPSDAKVVAWWFGGGSDLTPAYLYEEDAIHFHSTLKAVCGAHGSTLYSTFKKWCDEYFYIKHREEARGVGGIFFRDLADEHHKRLDVDPGVQRPRSQDEVFTFVKQLCEAFLPSYLPILRGRMDAPWTESERRWQLLRRGRYVEFNLVCDDGTRFGLTTPQARVESVLMALPEAARWEYMNELGTEDGGAESKLMEVLRRPRDWVE